MSFTLFRRFPLGLLALFLSLSAASNAADVVWTPETGWKIEGSALADLNTPDARNAVALMNKARTAEEKGRQRTALKYYSRVTKKYANSLYAPEAHYRIGNLRLERKQYTKAFQAFQAVATQYPSTKRFNELIGKQYHIAALLVDGARNRVWGIFPGSTNREKAVEYFETLLFEAPYSDYAPLALMNIAVAHQRFKNTEEAIDALDRLINTYPQSLLMPDAYLKLAQAHSSLAQGPFYDQGSTRDAITYFEDFLILFPADPNIASAEKGLDQMKKVLAESKVKMADFYFFKRDNYKAARVFYNEAITVYPDSDIATKARERLAQVDEAANKPLEPAKKRFFFF
jgi:outer membrane protein assembly factor BamD